MINETTFVFKTNIPEISETCWNWCSDTHFAYQNNLEISGLFIIVLSLAVLFFQYIILNYGKSILKFLNSHEETNISEEKLEKVYRLCSEFSMYLLLGFFIWFLYFK